jgi:hypothetical protein
MMKRKAFWTLLVAGMTVASTGVASAQWIDRETLTRMMSGAAGNRVAKSPLGSTTAAPRTAMQGANSLVGSWLETVTFLPEGSRPQQKGLVTFHHDGTLAVYDQANVTVTLDPPGGPPTGITGAVFSAGNGAWTQLNRRRFAYTQLELISDLNGNLIGYLKVRGIYTLDSKNTYTGNSTAEILDTNGNPLLEPVEVTNAGERILLERPPPDPQK